jgi:hypothetical protein
MFRKLALAFLFIVPLFANAETAGVMVVGFNLDDRTGIPNALEELERIALLTKSMKEALVQEGVTLVEPNARIQEANENNSATYLFDQVDEAAEMAKDSGAKYLLIAVALKPTYLFVYPRTLLVDIATGKVAQAKAFQLESSWSDPNTTVNTGKKIAKAIADELKVLENQ